MVESIDECVGGIYVVLRHPATFPEELTGGQYESQRIQFLDQWRDTKSYNVEKWNSVQTQAYRDPATGQEAFQCWGISKEYATVLAEFPVVEKLFMSPPAVDNLTYRAGPIGQGFEEFGTKYQEEFDMKYPGYWEQLSEGIRNEPQPGEETGTIDL